MESGSGSDNVIEECAICLCKVSNKATIDGCLHYFCFDCIKNWTKNSNNCPLCRRHIKVIRRINYFYPTDTVAYQLTTDGQLVRIADKKIRHIAHLEQLNIN